MWMFVVKSCDWFYVADAKDETIACRVLEKTDQVKNIYTYLM